MLNSVKLERHDRVALVTIDNRPVRNALNRSMTEELQSVFDRIDADPEIGCAVLTGANDTFCSGADTNDWADAFAEAGSDDAIEEADAMYGTFVRFGNLTVPTIAAVTGAAVGAGLDLAMAADLRIVARDARLIGGFMRAGIHPGGGFFTLASRLAGREAASALGIFSEEMSGERAVVLGLAWEALDKEQVLDRALELAATAAKDPKLVRRVTRSFRLETNGPRLPWDAAVELERGVQMWSQSRRIITAAAGAGN